MELNGAEINLSSNHVALPLGVAVAALHCYYNGGPRHGEGASPTKVDLPEEPEPTVASLFPEMDDPADDAERSGAEPEPETESEPPFAELLGYQGLVPGKLSTPPTHDGPVDSSLDESSST